MIGCGVGAGGGDWRGDNLCVCVCAVEEVAEDRGQPRKSRIDFQLIG